jgi:hypothetical protein
MGFFTQVATLADPLPPQAVTLRQGDRLSSFSAIIEDEYGGVLDLTDARCFVTLTSISVPSGEQTFVRQEAIIENAATGHISYDWQTPETLAMHSGLYQIVVEVEYPGDISVTVPSADQASVLNVRPSISSGYFLLNADGALVSKGEGGFGVDPFGQMPFGAVAPASRGFWTVMDT